MKYNIEQYNQRILGDLASGHYKTICSALKEELQEEIGKAKALLPIPPVPRSYLYSTRPDVTNTNPYMKYHDIIDAVRVLWTKISPNERKEWMLKRPHKFSWADLDGYVS